MISLTQVRGDRLKKHLAAVARPRDPFENLEALQQVQAYVEGEFLEYGYEVEKDPFKFQGEVFENLIAQKNPDADRRRLLIGAHFDAVPGTSGADDNASGVAALLEAARILAPLEAVRKINFLAFNVEECGMVGSSHYVKTLKQGLGAGRGAPLHGMISLEMLGYTSQEKGSQKIPLPLRPFYPDIGNFLALVGDSNSKKLLQEASRAFRQVEGLPVETLNVPVKGWIFPETRLSDHSPFWDAGYPALLVTDTSFFRNPHYHTPSDRIETLNLDFLAQVTEGIVRFASAVPC